MEVKELCASWLAAKQAESAANKQRLEIETELLALVGNKPEGSQTTKQDGFKITTTGKITRKLDADKWEEIKSQIPEALWPIKTKIELDDKGVKYLENNEPEIYRLLPIENKPAKTAVTVELLEE